ncbi:MAG: class SAM-dependent methyltransferase [Herminiimonas sp.]|nr:class SAM-dependent methyltransferase [Herminiimonas sp.]
MKNTLDADFNAMPAGGALEKMLNPQRDRMFDAFMAFKGDSETDSILEVSARSALLDQNAGCLLSRSEAQQRTHVVSCAIAAPGDQSRHCANPDNRQKYQRLDGRCLPFSDGEFDWVFCSEVIEHAGGFERQYELLKELNRVARKGVFVTTPNRWYPLEFNTAQWFAHWLPAAWWRRILKLSGRGAWAGESVLNLLDARALQKLTSLLPGKPKGDVGHLRLFGVKAHFFLQIRKAAGQEERTIP